MFFAGRVGLRCTALSLCLFAVAQWAQAQGTDADIQGRSAEQWLQTVQQAARQLNYSGTMVYQLGAEVRMSRIVHVFDGKVSRERLQPMDGRPREFIRQANEVKCLIPEARRVVVERRIKSESFPALADVAPAELLQQYSVAVVGRERVGGFDCQVLEIRPRQADRYGYRLWIDRATGLMLRSQTLNDRGDVLEQMAFADLRIGDGVDREQLKPSWSTEGWRVDESAYRPVDLGEQGWRVQAPVGFKSIYSVRRPMAAGDTLQAVFSDGLATLSVFFEPASTANADESMQQRGPINAYSRRIGDTQITVVGEIPAPTARAVADGLQRVRR